MKADISCFIYKEWTIHNTSFHCFNMCWVDNW